jgi:hypothetical protein
MKYGYEIRTVEHLRGRHEMSIDTYYAVSSCILIWHGIDGGCLNEHDILLELATSLSFCLKMQVQMVVQGIAYL